MNSLFKTITTAKADKNIVPFQKVQSGVSQEIFIQGLTLDMFIGVFESEKKAKQRVIVDANIEVTPTQNWQADDVANIVSYADVIEIVKNIAAQGHIDLVETFAEKIIEECFKSPAILKMSVSVAKPDIIEGVESVGAKITRQKL